MNYVAEVDWEVEGTPAQRADSSHVNADYGRRLYDVFCDDAYVASIWATSSIQAINKARNGADNMAWRAEAQHV